MSTIATNLNPIDFTKAEICAHIKAQSYFDNLAVLTDEKGDLDTTIAMALQKLGLGIAIEVSKGKVRFPAVGSSAVDMACVITIQENVLINRDEANKDATGKRAADVVCELVAIFNPMASAVPLTISDFDLVSNTGGVITYQINGTVQAGWKQKT